jgi:hypothetical protein
MPSVIATASSRPASTPSRIASAANGGGTKMARDGGAGRLGGVGHRVEDRHLVRAVLEELAALAGRDAGDDLRAVVERELGVAARRIRR